MAEKQCRFIICRLAMIFYFFKNSVMAPRSFSIRYRRKILHNSVGATSVGRKNRPVDNM
jgi:hypothetical protein